MSDHDRADPVSSINEIRFSLNDEVRRIDHFISDATTGARVGNGSSLGPTSDANNFFTVVVTPGEKVLVKVNYQGHSAQKIAQVDQDTVLRFDLP